MIPRPLQAHRHQSSEETYQAEKASWTVQVISLPLFEVPTPLFRRKMLSYVRLKLGSDASDNQKTLEYLSALDGGLDLIVGEAVGE